MNLTLDEISRLIMAKAWMNKDIDKFEDLIDENILHKHLSELYEIIDAIDKAIFIAKEKYDI